MVSWGVLAGGPLTDFPRDFDAYAGVDAGALKLVEMNLPLDLAVGDFDSISDEEFETVKRSAKRLVAASSHKDDTDLEMAVKAICKDDPEAHLTIYGALGGRMDHSLSSIFLPSHPELFPYLRQFELVDGQNRITYYPAGYREISPLSGCDYVGFMLEGRGQLTIKNAKYEMDEQSFFDRKIYGSNEFIDQPIQVTVPDGYLVVVYSKD
ncbi:thiamine diphosphokinase [Streptococcus merionis]|uniref:thiamine diphosphokinase n=1 Tax=Streptococcus merionis TaxID=400065 RepID=UPI0035133DD8